MPEGAPRDWGFLEWLSSAIVEMFAACGELKDRSRDVAIGWASMLLHFWLFGAMLGGASFFMACQVTPHDSADKLSHRAFQANEILIQSGEGSLTGSQLGG
jgi:hypothetical protein